MNPHPQATRWIIMFAKAPIAGRVKTRLGRVIGHDDAAALHEAFILDMAQTMVRFKQETPNSRDVQLCLAWSVQRDHPCFERLRQMGFMLIRQPEGDLGARLEQVTEQAFAQGAQRVVVTGTDSPTLLERHLHAAFEQLSPPEPTVVFGPSFDGGYYLVGLNHSDSRASEQIPWSAPDTPSVSIARLRQRARARCHLLEFWYDVDTVEDLDHLRRHLDYLNGMKALSGAFEHTNAQLTRIGQEAKNG